MPFSAAALLSAATRTFPRRCVTSATISLTGDAVSQHAFERKPIFDHDYMRSARIAVYGGAIFAPIMNAWFAIIGRIVYPNLAIQTVARVAVDQFIGGPCFPAIFYTSLTLLEGGTLQQVKTKLKAAWYKTWIVGFCVFTPASIINQSVILPQHRVLFMNGVGLCWNVYLSHSNNKHKNVNLVSEFDAIKDQKFIEKAPTSRLSEKARLV